MVLIIVLQVISEVKHLVSICGHCHKLLHFITMLIIFFIFKFTSLFQFIEILFYIWLMLISEIGYAECDKGSKCVCNLDCSTKGDQRTKSFGLGHMFRRS